MIKNNLFKKLFVDKDYPKGFDLVANDYEVYEIEIEASSDPSEYLTFSIKDINDEAYDSLICISKESWDNCDINGSVKVRVDYSTDNKYSEVVLRFRKETIIHEYENIIY